GESRSCAYDRPSKSRAAVRTAAIKEHLWPLQLWHMGSVGSGPLTRYAFFWSWEYLDWSSDSGPRRMTREPQHIQICCGFLSDWCSQLLPCGLSWVSRSWSLTILECGGSPYWASRKLPGARLRRRATALFQSTCTRISD